MDDRARADDGVELWVAPATGGLPAVGCHGGPGLWDMFGPLAALLAGAVALHRWDQRGCGRSDRRGPYTVARSVADLDAVRRHLGLERTALLGHSWGATLALHYALAHPARVTGLVYVSGTGVDPGTPWHARYRASLERRIGRAPAEQPRTADKERERCVVQWSADFADPDRARAQAERLADPWFGVNYACNADLGADTRRLCDAGDLADRCRRLGVPALIIDGEADIRPRDAVDSLAAALPSVRRVELAGAGHLPWVEDPVGFRDAVTAFLAA